MCIIDKGGFLERLYGCIRTAYDFRVRVCGGGEPRLDDDGADDAMDVF